MPRSRPPSARLGLAIALGLGLGIVSVTACRGPAGPPAGKTLRGEADAFRGWLSRIEELEGTRAAGAAREALDRLDGCSRFVARCEEAGCDPLHAITCDPDPAVDPEPNAAGWIYTWREGNDWLEVTAAESPASDDPTARLSIRYHPSTTEDARSLVLPGSEDPVPANLSSEGRFLRLRLRPEGGLDLTRFVEEEGWGARLYRLRSGLFTAAAFEGSLELGFYRTTDGMLVPPFALALPLSDPELAAEGLATFVDEIQETWPVRFAPYRFGETEGLCAINLDILPDLAPCGVVLSDILVLGWNPPSVAAALAGRSEAPVEPEGAPSGLLLDLDLVALHRVDAAIRRASAAEVSEPIPSRYPWSALELRGRRRGGEFHFDLHLRP